MHDIQTAPLGRNSKHDRNNPVTQIRVQLGDTELKVSGRDAWALHELIEAGASGVTPIDNPAPRWSHYIFKLRRSGFDIATVDEPHGGAFSGHHARYHLRSPVAVLDIRRQGDGRAAQ